MDLIEYALPGEWINALGWTVLHSLWQAALIALIVGVVLYRMPQQPAWRRYWVAHFGWFSIIICALITFLTYYHPQQGASLETITRLTPEGEVTTLASPSFLGSFFHILNDYFNEHLPLIVSLWALGMAFFLLRFLGGLIFLQHLRTYRVQPLSSEWEEKVSSISRRLGLRRPVQLLESALVKVPMVIGWIKPAILLPVGALNALSPQQVEAILAHELAHIKRHDYVLNLIRSLVEVLFYFNPAVWWLSAQIRREREHCCDDMALEVCGDSLSYVRALVTLQEISQRPLSGLAMTFVRSKPELLNRVRRILNQPKDKSDLMEKLVITCLLLLCLSFTLLSAAMPEEPAAKQETSDSVPETELHFETLKAEPLTEVFSSKAGNIIVEIKKQPENPELQVDTIPRGTTHLKMSKAGKSYDVKIRNKKIQRLSIDGKVIPENELINYYDLVQELLDEVPPPPAPPAPPAAPEALPAPPAPPAPPGPVMETANPVPSPPLPPAPPVPAKADAPPLPPSPPPVPRIRLEKPVKEEGGMSLRIHRKIDDRPMESPHTESYALKTMDNPAESATVWVSREEIPLEEHLLVVRVNEGNVVQEQAQNVLVEVITGDQLVTADVRPGTFITANSFVVEEEKPATSYRFSGDVPHPANSSWKVDLEKNLLTDLLVNPGESYQVELSGERLLINGQEQPKEQHEKYLLLLQQTLDQPLDKDAMYFFNRRSNRQVE